MSAAKRVPITTFHKWVLALGLPFVFIPPFIYLVYGMQAHDGPTHSRGGAMFGWTIRGEYVVDPDALVNARIWLAIWFIGSALTIAGAVAGALRMQRGPRGETLDTSHGFQDAPYWSVGDRAGWRTDERVFTGTVVEVHRREFRFGDDLIEAVAGIPGLVMKSDADGALIARPLATVYRIAGTTGPSGTMESIRASMNDAVQPGDTFAWLNAANEPVEGVVVEKHHEPFEVAGKRVDASPAAPGYTVRREPDGELVAVGNDLREG